MAINKTTGILVIVIVILVVLLTVTTVYPIGEFGYKIKSSGSGGGSSGFYDVAVTKFTAFPLYPYEGQEVFFDCFVKNVGTKTTKDLGYNLNFGDGTGSGGAGPIQLPPGGVVNFTALHVYNYTDNFTAKCTASTTRDRNSANNQMTTTVHVYPYYSYLASIYYGYGSIFVSSIPWQARTYLDNVYQGLTPILMDYVETGMHQVKITKTGYNDYINTVNVTLNETIYLINVTLTQSSTRSGEDVIPIAG